MKKQAFLTLSLFGVVACVAALSDNAHAITRGKSLNQSHAMDAGIAMLNGMSPSGENKYSCSGVFISDQLLLTAKHCVSANESLFLTMLDGRKLNHPVAADSKDIIASKDLDLALVLFPSKTAKHWATRAAGSPLSSQVQIRGYSVMEDLQDFAVAAAPGKGVERVAKVPVFAAKDDEITLRLHPTASYATEGDSGGPVLGANGELEGILINVQEINDTDEYGNNWVENQAVWLQGPVAARFLTRATAMLEAK